MTAKEYRELHKREHEEEAMAKEQARIIAKAISGGNHPAGVAEYIKLHDAEVIRCGKTRKYWCC